MVESDFIKLHSEKKDRTIHTVYTPKEIAHIITVHFNGYMGWHKLTHGEKLIVWDFANNLIGEFKDD